MFFKVECDFRVYGPEVYCRPILCGIEEGRVYWEYMDIKAIEKLERHYEEKKNDELGRNRHIFSSDR